MYCVEVVSLIDICFACYYIPHIVQIAGVCQVKKIAVFSPEHAGGFSGFSKTSVKAYVSTTNFKEEI